MKWAVIALVTGCGFSTTVEPTSQSGIDAEVAIDAPPDVALQWQVAEMFNVDTAAAAGRRSTMVLADGVTYRLRVSGTASVIDGITGDGEYYDFAAPKDIACCEDVGIGIDDPTVDKSTTPDWGPYNPAHVYEIEFVGKGAQIHAVYQDTLYSNNSGNLKLEILELR